MHEYSIVEDMIQQLLEELKKKDISEVKEVHVKRGSTFAEGPLQQAFAMLSPNTPLENAKLVVEEYSVEHTCKNCGRMEVVNADDLLGHMYVCQECGTSEEIDEAHSLELLGIVTPDEGEGKKL